MTSSIKLEVHNLATRHQSRAECRQKFGANVGENQTCSSDDMIVDGRTHRHTGRHAHRNTPLPYRGRCNENKKMNNESGARFTKYLTIYRKIIVRSTYDSDLKSAKISSRNIVS